ncbi:MAG TPA: tyrosine-type recombinase/integrase, partial [Phycisphaerae bacterium]|nr:tyrosine-type recombinase/integrase [Phycisphaerae bacterium]
SKFLSNRQVKKLLRVAKMRAEQDAEPRSRAALRDHVIMHLALATGLRVAELSMLTCGDILIDGAMASLRVRCGKGGKPRTVHFNGASKPLLLRYL